MADALSPTGSPATMTPEIEQELTRLRKLEKEHAALGYKVRAWEKVGQELGDVIERDQHGNPVRVVVDDAPSAPVSVNGHPLSALGLERPESVDRYYLDLINKQGYLTKKQAEELAEDRAQRYASIVMGNAQVWRMHDKLVSQADYGDLSKKDSDLSKRTARILQERQYGAPMKDTWNSFDEWRFRDLGDLRFAADMARLEMSKEAAEKSASEKAAAEAKAGAGLADGGQPGAGAGGSAGRPDFKGMKTEDDVIAALDTAMQAGIK